MDLNQKSTKENSLDELKKQYRQKLERLSGISCEEAKELLLAELDKDLVEEKALRIRKMEEQLGQESDKKARELLLSSLQRVATEHVAEVTTSTVKLPDEEMKGRIIGKEGRNIKALEAACGVNLVIDDTPRIVTVSSFDPVRREVARIALERLVADGRIQPSRIEEVVKKVKEEIDGIIWEAGEDLAFRAGVVDLPVDIINLLGRFKFRTSYGQNMVEHTLEVVNIGRVLAAELKADVELVKKACLLHDIGKAVSAEVEGPHDQVGAEIARRYGISEEVVKTFEGHHTGNFPNQEAIIVYLADTISGARPGARQEDYDAYLNRVKELENIAKSFPGVEDAYAISAGREVRVIVRPEEILESEMVNLAHEISLKIHRELKNFPGQIKVNVIRETRAAAYATAETD
ncbi:ribonuclease Y [candidate division CPR3 bacterium 4484_211]|uniref:Ribonuclease Y n=1 Tax=candidate division CPR3 bacterium 4484_211 TaxID=1968527 RepID=A0A1W9NY70_UNCC3|nr:MAG: ribonuclease Y [candidate division CPR3 bacterium 4484_211]